ncbi:DUF3857 domain-containing transglutaminase family protein [Burkholderia singularis]|uniref:Transglutaminase-like domain-containing protein n=1 Tax=Burkholderia singularis TaxID=1503053 RepID=A0A238HB46_9BURK|nr:DUF3857 domain-containing protein [Burkholderia singularis]SMG02275.1 FIG00954953: hypothetical protein [Burkholderia singularis]
MKFRCTAVLARAAATVSASACVTVSFAALQPIDEAPVAQRVDQTCRIRPDTGTDCTTVRRLTILRPVGRDLLSRLDFDYREQDRFELKDAAVIGPDGQRTPVSGAQIDTRTAPNPAAGFMRNKRTSVAFPGLRVGSTVVFTTLEHTAPLPLARQFHEAIWLRPMPIRNDAYRIEYTAEQPILWRAEQIDAFRVASSNGGKRLVIEQKQPRYVNVVDEDGTTLRRVPRIELASSLNAQDHFGAYAKRYNEILAAPLPGAAAAAVRDARALPAAARVAELMKHIDAHYRYLGDWRASERGYVPFELAQIEANGYGDCKDLAILLAAMLNASGIAARPAWVYAGSFAPSLLIPGAQAPNHAIVRAVVDGETWWLDPTQPVRLPGRTPAALQDRWALVVDAGGGVRNEHIGAEAPIVSIDATLNSRPKPDGSAQVTGHAYFGGEDRLGLMDLDRDRGTSAGDQALCKKWLNEPRACEIKRMRSDDAPGARYRVEIDGIDGRALEQLSGQHVYDGGKLRQLWEQYADYRQTSKVGDVFLHDASIMTVRVQLDGVKPVRPLAACAARSPWYDLDVTPQAASGGIAYRYRVAQKTRWLNHDDLTSDAFGRFLDDARRCTDTLRQSISF